MTLGEMAEEDLLAHLFPRARVSAGVRVGVGDDCAVVGAAGRKLLQVLKTDCVVEGVHFEKTARPSDVGWKAMARPLSDFAAMSARPRFALVTIVLPRETTLVWTAALYRGLRKAAAAFDVAIVGGETSSTAGPATIVVALAGEVEVGRQTLRSGGRVGDAIYVTGTLGGSIRGRHLRFMPRVAEARWLTRHFAISAMMDLSDGLGADLPRLAKASGVGFAVHPDSIPRTRGCSIDATWNDGEDFELLFTIAADAAARLERRWKKQWPLKLTRIGALTAKQLKQTHVRRGFDHFAKR